MVDGANVSFDGQPIPSRQTGRYIVSELSNLASRICRFPRSDPSDRVSGSGPPIRIWTSSGRFRSSLSPDPESGENWSRIEKTARFPQTRPVWVKSDPPGQFGPPVSLKSAYSGSNRTSFLKSGQFPQTRPRFPIGPAPIRISTFPDPEF